MNGFDLKMNEADYDSVTAKAQALMPNRKAYPEAIENAKSYINQGATHQEAALAALESLSAHQVETEAAILQLAKDLYQSRGVSLRTLAEATGVSAMTLKRRFEA